MASEIDAVLHHVGDDEVPVAGSHGQDILDVLAAVQDTDPLFKAPYDVRSSQERSACIDQTVRKPSSSPP